MPVDSSFLLLYSAGLSSVVPQLRSPNTRALGAMTAGVFVVFWQNRLLNFAVFFIYVFENVYLPEGINEISQYFAR